MPKFGYAAKYNGKYYPANADIPEAAPAEEKPWKYEGPETSTEEAAQKAAEAAQEPATEEAEATAEEKPEAPEKATKRRKKGDA